MDIHGPAPGESAFYDALRERLLVQLLHEMSSPPQVAPSYQDNASAAEQARMHQQMLNDRAAAIARILGPDDAFRVPDANTFDPNDVTSGRFYQNAQENI